MALEIKFRAFLEKELYGDAGDKPAPRMLSWEELCDGTESLQSYLTPEPSFSNVSRAMQYTGSKDKNGKEIYEGDIVELHTGHSDIKADFGKHLAVVKFRDGGACFDMCGLMYLPDGTGYTFDNGGVFSIEVMGNVHENKELLKVDAV